MRSFHGHSDPLIISIYYKSKKHKIIIKYLEDFIDETCYLIEENILSIKLNKNGISYL